MRNNGKALTVVTCDKGVNQATHPRLSPVGTFDTVQNMRIRGSGLLEKRPGSRAIGSVTLDDVAPPLVASGSSYGPSFLAAGLLGSTSGYVYAHNSTGDAMVPSGRFATCQPKRRRAVLMGGDTGTTEGVGAHPASVAVNTDGYVMTATLTEAGFIVATIDAPDGTRVFIRKDGTAVERVKCIAQGTRLILIYSKSTGEVLARDYLPSAAAVTIGSESTLTSFAKSGGFIDAVGFSSTHWFAMWHLAANTFVLAKIATTTIATNISITQSNSSAAPVSLFANSTNVWASWIRSGPSEILFAAYLASNLSTVLAPTTFSGSVGATSAPLLMGPGTSDANAYYVLRDPSVGATLAGRVDTGGTVSELGNLSGVLPISKPDEIGRFWAFALTETLLPDTTRVVLLLASRTIDLANVELALDEMPFVSLAVSGLSSYGYFSNQAPGSDSRFFAAPFVLTTVGSEQLSRFDVLEYTTCAEEPHRSVGQTSAALVCAGQPVELGVVTAGLAAETTDAPADQGSCEIGFAAPPAISLASAGGGTEIAAGTYSYQAVYEWADGLGRRHQSAPSEPKEITLAAPGRVSVTHTLCDITRHNRTWALSAAYVVLYRTTAGGTEPHRLPVNTIASSGTVTDSTTDAAVADEEFIYTTGNVLANVLAPSCRFLRQAADRLWCGGLWTDDQLECSKVIVPDEQTAFTGHPSHRVSIGRPVTGLAVLDDQLAVFTKDAIFTITGEGPNDQGIGGFVVRSVSSGIGCIDERSICETDIGAIFRSRLGYYLLPRGFGAPQYIGAAVQDAAAAFPNSLGSAVWHGNGTHLARLLAENDAGDDSVVFSFDLNSGQWFVDTFDVNHAEIGVWPSGFVQCRSTFDTATTSNPIWLEDPDEVADGVFTGFTGYHVEQRLRTAWIMPGGPGAEGEVKQTLVAVLPTFASSVTMLVEVDGTERSHTQTWAFSVSENIAYRYLVQPDRHGVAHRVTLYDGEVGGEPTGGVKFVAITLESEPDGGMRLPEAGETS